MKNLILAVFTFFSLSSEAKDSLILTKTIPIQCKYFSTDLVGNIYVAKEDNSLIKYNINGDSLAYFNEIRKGNLKQIDATNPLRVLLYYPDFNQIVILDNMLSKKNVLKLNSIGIFNSPCIANSIDGNIWIFDAASNSLLKIDDQLDLISTTNLRNIFKEGIDAVSMVEQERNLLIVDSLQGIFKFDLYGFYNTTFHFKTTEIQYLNKYLVYTQLPNLVSYNTQTISEKSITLPNPSTIKQVRIERNKVYILRKNELEIYDLIQS